MKKDIHPKSHRVCFVDISTGTQFKTTTTVVPKHVRIEVIDGDEYYMVPTDVTSASHPAYTGKKRFVDTAGRVEKFNKKFKRSAS